MAALSAQWWCWGGEGAVGRAVSGRGGRVKHGGGGGGPRAPAHTRPAVTRLPTARGRRCSSQATRRRHSDIPATNEPHVGRCPRARYLRTLSRSLVRSFLSLYTLSTACLGPPVTGIAKRVQVHTGGTVRSPPAARTTHHTHTGYTDVRVDRQVCTVRVGRRVVLFCFNYRVHGLSARTPSTDGHRRDRPVLARRAGDDKRTSSRGRDTPTMRAVVLCAAVLFVAPLFALTLKVSSAVEKYRCDHSVSPRHRTVFERPTNVTG